VLVLGIESSCDETAAAVVDQTGRVFSDVVHSQAGVHVPYGGVVPELASRDHFRNVGPVVRAALDRARVSLAAIDGVAVTNRPGLVGALLVGVQTAKGLAWAARKPIVGVDHLIGHLLSVFVRREGGPISLPEFPFVCLLASGGHTAVYRVDGPQAEAIRELGATRDDAAGEAFDKVAKMLDLPYPGGPAIERAAALGDPTRFKLVTPMASSETAEMSFSGLKTQVAQRVFHDGAVKTEADVRDLCATFQAAVAEVLSQKVICAAVRENVAHVVLGGGVAANGELRRRALDRGGRSGLQVHIPAIASCTDNAAMIAYAGSLRLARHERDTWDLAATSQTILQRRTRKGGGRR
jgi:N6-L-threonylcarbamoyladenine synthase